MIYSPAEDSFLLQSYVKKLSKNKSVLDLGAGSGIQGITALESKAKSVLFSDINEESVIHIKKLGQDAIKSNLFSKIKGKFDLIIFNPPYLPKDKREDKESALITSGGKKGDEILLKFFNQAKNHLNKKGFILMVLSSLTPKDRIERTIKKQKLKKRILRRENFFMESIEVWMLKR